MRGHLATDGFFSVPRSRFGCPELDAEQTLKVVCIPSIPTEFGHGEVRGVLVVEVEVVVLLLILSVYYYY